jgi:hypothetical protein
MSYHLSTYDPKRHTIYHPLNEDKYKGKLPVCRSSWETKFCEFCDGAINVVQWSSESVRIPYYDVMRKKNRLYFPDFVMSVKETNGRIQNYMIEIKPFDQTFPPKKGEMKDKTYMTKFIEYQTNLAKWKAAQIFCRKRGVIFRIITEKDLFKEQGK